MNTISYVYKPNDIQPGYVKLNISRQSTTVLQIDSGLSIHNHNLSKRLVLTSNISLSLTNASDFVNSSSRSTNTWYHILIGTDSSSGNLVGGLSTTLNKPSGWDDWQQIGAWRTNATGGGEWDTAEQNGEWFFRSAETTQYNTTSLSTTPVAIRAYCPPGKYLTQYMFRSFGAASAQYLLIRQSSGGSNLHAPQLDSGARSPSLPIITDSSGNFYLACTASIPITFFQAMGLGFRYPVGEAS